MKIKTWIDHIQCTYEHTKWSKWRLSIFFISFANGCKFRWKWKMIEKRTWRPNFVKSNITHEIFSILLLFFSFLFKQTRQTITWKSLKILNNIIFNQTKIGKLPKKPNWPRQAPDDDWISIGNSFCTRDRWSSDLSDVCFTSDDNLSMHCHWSK